MTRRPPTPPDGNIRRAHQRMAPGGRLWSESPVKGPAVRVVAAGDDPEVATPGGFVGSSAHKTFSGPPEGPISCTTAGIQVRTYDWLDGTVNWSDIYDQDYLDVTPATGDGMLVVVICDSGYTVDPPAEWVTLASGTADKISYGAYWLVRGAPGAGYTFTGTTPNDGTTLHRVWLNMTAYRPTAEFPMSGPPAATATGLTNTDGTLPVPVADGSAKQVTYVGRMIEPVPEGWIPGGFGTSPYDYAYAQKYPADISSWEQFSVWCQYGAGHPYAVEDPVLLQSYQSYTGAPAGFDPATSWAQLTIGWAT